MANYPVPSVQIQQEFTQIPILATNPLTALIIGPQKNIFGYRNAKDSTVVLNASDETNAYAGSSKTFVLQDVADLSLVDVDSFELFLDQAVAEYYAPASPSAITVVSSDTSGKTIRQAGTYFKTGFSHNNNIGPGGDTLSRNVQVGDTVVITGDSSYKLVTTVESVTYSTSGGSTPSTGTLDHTANSGETPDATLTVGGTYAGTQDITYKVIITQDNGSGVPTQFKVLSDNVDSSGPFAVTGATTAFNIGTLGLTGSLAKTTTSLKLMAGDFFTVAVTVSTPSAYDSLVLNDAPIGTTLKLAGLGVLLTDVFIPRYSSEDLSTPVWTYAPTTGILTVNASIATPTTAPTVGYVFTTISGLADVTNGTTLALRISAANVYLSRADWVTSNVGAIGSVTDPSAVEAALGVVDPGNPLAQGVYNAAINANGTPVYYTAVGVNDGSSAGQVAAYSAALQLTRKSSDYYSIVPLTFDSGVQQLVQGHVNAMSNTATSTQSPTRTTKWRIAWFSVPVQETQTIVGLESDKSPWKATVSSTAVSVQTTTDTPNMRSAGVKAGDILNYNFQLDTSNNVVYNSVAITAVPTESTITIANSITPNISPFKFTITRALAPNVKASALAAAASSFNDHRVRCVFPDVYESGGVTLNGYFLAAALAGQRSGVVPHQPLTNYTIIGPTIIQRTLTEFSDQDLDTMAAGGVWIVDQTVANGPAFTRHQLTTGEISGSLNLSEDSITCNTDSISYALQSAVAPYIGVYNINAAAILKVRAAIDNTLTTLMTTTYTETAGNQLNSYTINSIARDTTFLDLVRASVTVDEPAPMNHVIITLLV